MQVLSSRVPMATTMIQFVRRDGVLSLWNGLSASILRQSTYSTARFALYEHFIGKWSGGKTPDAAARMLCAGAAGAFAGLIGNPAEIVLVRMCSDGARLPDQRYRYSNALQGLWRIGVQEGVATYTRGLGPNVVRSILMNVSQIAAYSEAKQHLLAAKSLRLRDNTTTHILASFMAGTVATTVCAPADVLKSRFQATARTEGAGHTSIARYVLDTMRKEGPQFLMKGWLPAWCRLAPNTVLTFVFMEKLKAAWRTKAELPQVMMTSRA